MIFGTGHPQFKASSDQVYPFHHAKIVENSTEEASVTRKSNITQNRLIDTPNWVYGAHKIFSFRHHIFKMPQYPVLDGVYLANYHLYGQTGILWPHADGLPFMHGSPGLIISDVTESGGTVTVTHNDAESQGFNSELVVGGHVWIRGVIGAVEVNGGPHKVTEVTSVTQFKFSLSGGITTYSSAGAVDKCADFKCVDITEIIHDRDINNYVSFLYTFRSLNLVHAMKHSYNANGTIFPAIESTIPNDVFINILNDGVFARLDTANNIAYFVNPLGLRDTSLEGEKRVVDGATVRSKGLIFESARHNDMDADFQDMSAWDFTGSGMSVSANTSEADDAEGGNLADKVTQTSGTPTDAEYTSGLASGNYVTVTMLIKSESGDVPIALGYVGTGSGSTTPVAYTVAAHTDGQPNGYQKISHTQDTSGLTGDIIVQFGMDGSNGDVVYVDSVLMEDDKQFSGTLVGDTDVPADKWIYTYNQIFSQDYKINRTKGTIGLRVKPFFDPGEQDGGVLFQSGSSATNQHIKIGYLNTTSNFFIQANQSNGSTINVNESVDSSSFVSKDTWVDIVITYDTTISNGFKVYADGVLRKTTTNDAFNISETGGQFAVGSRLDGLTPLNGVVDQNVFISNRVLGATEVSQIWARK